jgi:nucleotide-binding universal stress UspA family protein
MFPMKRILFPVDFSERSACVARYAAALQCISQAELTVLHVVPEHAGYTGVNAEAIDPYALEIAWSEARLAEAKEKMAEFIDSQLHGVPATPCVRSGNAAKVIVQQANAMEADLIIMATHGFDGFRRMLLGSVTAKVLHDASRPVLTSAHYEYTPATIAPFRNVLCAVDFGPESEAVVRWADEFARSFAAKLTVSHILPVLPMGQWGYCEADATVAMRKDAKDQGRQLLESTGAQADLLIESGGVVETLKHVAKEKKADLLVIGRHHLGGILGRLRDTAYAAIRESPCPVVSVEGSGAWQKEVRDREHASATDSAVL